MGKPNGAFPFFTSSPEQARWTDTPRFPSECLVFGTGGGASVHHAAIPFDASADCLIATPVSSRRVDCRFVLHYLTWNIAALEAGFRGAGLKHISRSYIESIPIPLPSVPEQLRTSEVLDHARSLRARRLASFDLLDRLKQSLFVDMFGDPVKNDMGWPVAKVADLCNLVRGSSPRPQGDKRYFGGSVPRLMVADITRDGWNVTPRIDSLTVEGAKRSRPVKAGTVVMAVSGNVGLVSRLAVDACVHDGFVAFTGLDGSRCDASYLLAMLHYSKSLHDRKKAGAIFINLTTADIKSMILPLPPIASQREFSRRLLRVDNLTELFNHSRTRLDAMLTSLQQRAFCGAL